LTGSITNLNDNTTNTTTDTYFTGQTIECPYTDKCIKHQVVAGLVEGIPQKKIIISLINRIGISPTHNHIHRGIHIQII